MTLWNRIHFSHIPMPAPLIVFLLFSCVPFRSLPITFHEKIIYNSKMSTPAPASNNATEEKQDPTLAEVVRKLDTENLIEFLSGEEDLKLDEDDFKIISSS